MGGEFKDMTTPDLTTKIKPDGLVRIRSGAVVASDNPKRPRLEVRRPYWIRVVSISDGEITWRGSANYACRTAITNVDAVEDLS